MEEMSRSTRVTWCKVILKEKQLRHINTCTRSSLELVFAALFCSNPASAKAEVLFRDLQICQPIGPSGTVGQGVAISLSQEDEQSCRHPLLCCIILAFVGFLLESAAGFLNLLQSSFLWPGNDQAPIIISRK